MTTKRIFSAVICLESKRGYIEVNLINLMRLTIKKKMTVLVLRVMFQLCCQMVYFPTSKTVGSAI